MDGLRRSQSPATPDTSDPGSQASEEWGDLLDTLRSDCDARSSHNSGELYRRTGRDYHRSLYGGGYLMVCAPSHRDADRSPPSVLGGPLHGRELSSSSADRPVRLPVPYFFPTGKGKNYSLPPWYNQHFGIPDPPSDEEEAPVENTLTLPQESYDLPRDMVHIHRYGFGKGKWYEGMPVVKGKPAYTLEYRNDKGKGKQMPPSGTPSHADDGDGAGEGEID